MHGTFTQRRGDTAAQLRRLAARANAEARAADDKFREAVAHAIRCGEALLKAQALERAANGYGKWGTWLRKNFKKTARLANFYMQLAAAPPEVRKRVSKLPLREALKVVSHKRLLQHDDHQTPRKYVDPVRRVFGGTIDLDPCSCAKANATVRATTVITKEQNGLALPWHGNVFANIPYSEAAKWIPKALEEYRAGRAKAVILLLPGWRCADWFKPLWDFPLCFTWERIRFHNGGNPSNGSIYVYLGPEPLRFKRVFDPNIGPVEARMRERRSGA